MPRGAQKVKTKLDGDALREKCEDESGVSCTLSWTDQKDRDKVGPDDDTVAIVVDMRQVTSSAVRIFTKEDKYVDIVGMEYAGSLVIVLWKSEWSYFCTGECRVGCARRKVTDDV